jgi:hypothetical protein
MRNIIIISLLLSIIVASCEEDVPHNIAEGVIVHSGTKKPLEGVKVYMYDGVGHSSGWVDIGGSDTKGNNRDDSTVTDANGFFHIELDAEEPVLYLYKEGYSFEYTMGGAVIGVVPLSTGVNKNLKFELDAWAYLNPWFIGKKCLTNDTMIFDIVSKEGVTEGWQHTFIGKGPHKYSSFEGYPMKGDTYKNYIIKYQNNGMWFSKIDSVYVPSFSTWSDTIWY